jgi:TPR repeat protein
MLARRSAWFAICAAVFISMPSQLVAAPQPSHRPSALDAALDRRDYPTALKLALPPAQKGDPQAQHVMGLLYDQGWGVKQDFARAADWYRKAAGSGVMAAQVNLGDLYSEGRGVPHDPATAVYWWRKAADQGAAQAYYNLGSSYEAGSGVPQDFRQAAAWYKKAASVALRAWGRTN